MPTHDWTTPTTPHSHPATHPEWMEFDPGTCPVCGPVLIVSFWCLVSPSGNLVATGLTEAEARAAVPGPGWFAIAAICFL